MFDRCEPISTATRRRPSEPEDMSQRCWYCDDSVPTDEWHPVVTVRNDDGEVEVLPFCNDECRSGWSADREEASK